VNADIFSPARTANHQGSFVFYWSEKQETTHAMAARTGCGLLEPMAWGVPTHLTSRNRFRSCCRATATISWSAPN
jgi:hypothetical protein